VPGRELRLAVPDPEPVELTLLLPPECRATTPNPQTVVPDRDASVRASFGADCGTE
jgi:hypothetical protein